VKYSGSPDCDFSLFIHDGKARMSFEYGGELYDIKSAKKPDVAAPANERQVGGLGLFLVGKIADQVEYVVKNGHNFIVVEKAY
jgi:anti-sigma regulatory factor (Ser/Thr protein kinase)